MNFITKLGDWLERHVMPIASVIGSQRHLSSLRDGFIATLAVNMAGAMASLLNAVIFKPDSVFGKMLNKIDGYANSVQPIFDKYFAPVMGRVWWATIAIITIFLVISISYSLAKSYEVDGLAAALSSTAAFFAVFSETLTRSIAFDGGQFLDADGKVVQVATDALNGATQVSGDLWGIIDVGAFGELGAGAMFTGIIVAMLATELFVKVTKAGWTIKMPEQVPPAVSRAFSAILPACISILVFSIIGIIFTNFVGKPLMACIEDLIQKPLVNLGQSPITYIFMILLAQLLWFFGLHGSNMTDPAMNTMYKPPLYENMEAALNNQEIPNTITRNFLDVYAMHGGSGATLGLLVAIYLFSKRQEQRELFKLALAPGLFNINEPVIFGLPMVLNPIMFIPFVLTPPICVFIAYVFTEWIPFAGKIMTETPWTTPPIFGAYLATGGSWQAAVVAAGTFLLSILMYAPFVIASNRIDVNQEA